MIRFTAILNTMKTNITLLTALLLAPLAALHVGRSLLGVPRFGILRGSSFQSLEIFVAMASNDWN